MLVAQCRTQGLCFDDYLRFAIQQELVVDELLSLHHRYLSAQATDHAVAEQSKHRVDEVRTRICFAQTAPNLLLLMQLARVLNEAVKLVGHGHSLWHPSASASFGPTEPSLDDNGGGDPRLAALVIS